MSGALAGLGAGSLQCRGSLRPHGGPAGCELGPESVLGPVLRHCWLVCASGTTVTFWKHGRRVRPAQRRVGADSDLYTSNVNFLSPKAVQY